MLPFDTTAPSKLFIILTKNIFMFYNILVIICKEILPCILLEVLSSIVWPFLNESGFAGWCTCISCFREFRSSLSIYILYENMKKKDVKGTRSKKKKKTQTKTRQFHGTKSIIYTPRAQIDRNRILDSYCKYGNFIPSS